jgi:hypothetical protein
MFLVGIFVGAVFAGSTKTAVGQFLLLRPKAEHAFVKEHTEGTLPLAVGSTPYATISVDCPQGYTAIAGGFTFAGGTANSPELISDGPDGNGWEIAGWNEPEGGAEKTYVWVYCANNSIPAM